MKTSYVVAGILVAIAVIGATIFVWPMLESLSVEGGLGVVVTMIVACFAVGGALTFLLVYSGRRGYDDTSRPVARPADKPVLPRNGK
jgi:hypothetical protein